MAKIIVFEGPDRVGKATQSKILVERLSMLGCKVIRVEVPVRNFFHEFIYNMLDTGSAKKHPNFFQILQTFNRMLFQLTTLKKLCDENDYVVFDRWSLSTLVYGTAGNANTLLNKFLFSIIKKPDYTIIINGLPKTKEMRDSYEKDNDIQRKVRALYSNYAEKNEGCCTMFNSISPIDVLSIKIINLLFEKNIIDYRGH